MTVSNSRLKDEAAAARAAIMEQMRSGYGRMLGVESKEEKEELREDLPSREENARNLSDRAEGKVSPERTSFPYESFSAQKEDPRFQMALEWVESLRAEMEREEVHASDLMRLISEALTVIESFITPDTENLLEEADDLFLEASEILASLDGSADSRRKVERALQILTASIERAEAAGKAVPRSYQLRSRAYGMLAEMDKTSSALQ